ncbi:peptidylprolyl isomerase [Actinoplanes sp. NEAU-A12]|uniref:peptidylprolyl isomerase n=1 Tax=Actinoplanes sandaracinus TaxID=3045177 RepID=A0ABT6WNY1_9ACTN|nr:peptidylprolyl isomerase [Actinoplanes sandaracinus]MDI6101425.1 peptidylprolyl isomerase [Actinoplanes sandaracinus]
MEETVSSIKDRQRAAARARLEKEMSERATAARKRRQRQAIIGSALAIVVIAGVAFFVVQAMKDDDSTEAAAPGASTAASTPASAKPAPAGTAACTWTPEEATPGGSLVKDTGGLPPEFAPNTGKATLTMDTSLGKIVAAVDKSKSPCTAAAFEYLASKNFWDNTKCHRLTTEGIKVLQCGDPTATGDGYRPTDGTGGPNFKFGEENLPTTAQGSLYPAGTLAMAKMRDPGTTGSQFFLVYEDIPAEALPPQYTILGSITSGLDIVKKVAQGGTDDANQPGDGHPKTEINIKDLTLAAA